MQERSRILEKYYFVVIDVEVIWIGYIIFTVKIYLTVLYLLRFGCAKKLFILSEEFVGLSKFSGTAA